MKDANCFDLCVILRKDYWGFVAVDIEISDHDVTATIKICSNKLIQSAEILVLMSWLLDSSTDLNCVHDDILI